MSWTPYTAEVLRVIDGDTLAVERTPDILALLGTKKKLGQFLVGFAAETGDDEGSVLEHGRDRDGNQLRAQDRGALGGV